MKTHQSNQFPDTAFPKIEEALGEN